jgi:hypothetical protein
MNGALLNRIGRVTKVLTIAFVLAGYGNLKKPERYEPSMANIIYQNANFSSKILNNVMGYAAHNHKELENVVDAAANIQVELIKEADRHSKYCESNSNDSRNLETHLT